MMVGPNEKKTSSDRHFPGDLMVEAVWTEVVRGGNCQNVENVLFGRVFPVKIC